MKRNIIAIMMVMVALLATQCKKQTEPVSGQPEGETIEVTVRVENNTAKTDITATGAVTWKKGDRLYVVDETQGLLGHVSAVANGKSVYFDGSISAPTVGGVLRFYYVGDKSFALNGDNYTFDLSAQAGTLEGIAAHNQLMFGKSEPIASGQTNLGTITMTSQMAIAHLNITNNTSNTVTVTGGFATSTFNAKTYDGATLTGAAGTITLTSASAIGNCHLALLPGTQTLTFRAGAKEAKLSQKDVVANTFYNSESAIEVTMTLPEGALPGLFTVSDNGTPGDTSDDIKVCFSIGNLYYDGSAFKFEDNQYSYSCGGSDYNVNHISQFFWNKDYNKSIVQYYNGGAAATTDVFFTNATPETAKPDFTVNGVTGKYRNLSMAEWTYLYQHHEMKWITVCDKVGYAIAPDGVSADVISATYPDDTAWKAADDAGIVFLPATGRRGYTPTYINQSGWYWSSSPAASGNAYNIAFSSGSFNPSSSGAPSYGYSIRLVRNVE